LQSLLAIPHQNLTQQYFEPIVNFVETKMKLPHLVVAALALITAGAAPAADDYPSKPVKIIVGYVPGGSPDRIARLLSKRLSQVLGQAFIVDNKPGAGGTLATAQAARMPADGYTLLMGETGQLVIAPYVFKSLPYDTIKDFAPVARVSSEPVLLVTGAQTPFKTVQDLIREAKAHPGKFSYGSSGIGTIHHIAMAVFLADAGLKVNHVPYKGSGQSVPGVLSGDVPLLVTGSATAVPHVRAGTLRLLAVSTPQRLPGVPDAPSLSELYKDYDYASEIGVLAPAGLPAAVQNKLAEAIRKICEEPEFAARLSESGPAVAYLPPPKYAENLRANLKKYEPATKVANIQPN
jgi:tripartite-type tricarboxylate transporter receptor subunit TctC